MSLTAQTLLESPDYFPLRFEGANLQFVRMSRDSYAESIFTLPNRIVTDGTDSWSIPFAEIVQLVESYPHTSALPACIFQIAHCGSTLLSRALDQAGHSLVIRESFVLRQFAATPVIKQEQAQLAREKGLAAIWHLLGRQYQPAERVILKANLPVNFSLNEILEHAPSTVGILLYSNFEDYLLAILKADERRAWAQHVIRELAPRIKLLSGFEGIDPNALDSAQAAAVLWLVQIRCYTMALAKSNTLRTLNSDEFYQRPVEIIEAASGHLDIELSSEKIEQIVGSDLFTRHAKLPDKLYSESQRLKELSELRKRFSAELNSILAWCENQNFNTTNNFEGSNLL